MHFPNLCHTNVCSKETSLCIISKLTGFIQFQLPRTEEDIVAVLPDKSTTLEIMSITKLFSTRPEKSLGEWEFQSQYDPFALKAEKEWVEHVESVEHCSVYVCLFLRCFCLFAESLFSALRDSQPNWCCFAHRMLHVAWGIFAGILFLPFIPPLSTLWMTAWFVNGLETFFVNYFTLPIFYSSLYSYILWCSLFN